MSKRYKTLLIMALVTYVADNSRNSTCFSIIDRIVTMHPFDRVNTETPSR